MFRWRVGATWLATAAGILVIAGVISSVGLEKASWIASVVALVPVLVGFRRDGAVAESSSAQLDQAAAYLAEKSRGGWAAEAAIQGLSASPALRMRWAAVAALADPHAEGAVGRGATRTPAEVAEVYRDVASGRLVVLGERGGGKTAWLTLLVLGLLEDVAAGQPVPFLVSLSHTADAWRPEEEHLHAWLARRLVEEYPALRNARAYGSHAGRDLVTSGRVLPVLDGLDELDPRVRIAVVRAINAQVPASAPLVLACATADYERVASTDVVQLSSAIRLLPLAPAHVVEFLTPRRPTARWTAFLDHLSDGSDRVLQRALSTPLMVALLRTAYDAESDPTALTDRTALPTRAAVEAHLLDEFVPAIFARAARPRAVPWRRRRWRTRSAVRYLVFLARYLQRNQLREFRWWEFRRSVDAAAPALLFGLLGAVLITAAARVVRYAAGDHDEGGLLRSTWDHWIVTGTVLVLVNGLVLVGLYRISLEGDAGARTPRRLVGWRTFAQSSVHRESVTVYLAAGFGLVVGVAVAIRFGPAAGVPSGLASILLICLVQTAGVPVALENATSPRSLLAADRRVAVAGLLVSVAPLFLFMVPSFGVVSALVFTALASPFVLTIDLVGRSAWGPFVTVTAWHALRRDVPVRLLSFLAEAHRLGVLRRAGGAYQFRHSRLQGRLAAR